jgi:small subunit ribosomal protein S9
VAETTAETESTDTAQSTDTTDTPDTTDTTDTAEAPESFTSESNPETFTSVTPREIITAPSAATGRRKQAIARVRLTPGTGQWTVNGRPLDVYFPNKVHQQLVNDPFVTLEIDNRFDVIARIHGGGVSGQAGALRLAISRALNAIDEEGNRPALKRAGFLTRDPRAKERKKYGLKKARKAPQYSKR